MNTVHAETIRQVEKKSLFEIRSDLKNGRYNNVSYSLLRDREKRLLGGYIACVTSIIAISEMINAAKTICDLF